MKLLQISELIENGKNVIFYNKDVSDCFEFLKNDYLCIFFDEPIPIRVKMIEILKKLNPEYKFNKAHITIVELKEVISKEIKNLNLIILFNNFEKLTKSTVSIYQYLNDIKNIQFICSFKGKFKKEAYYFFKTFIFFNKKDYNPKKDDNQINITYALYAVLSIFFILIYIKISTSIYIATIMIGAIWFGLILFRTFMYAGGRV